MLEEKPVSAAIASDSTTEKVPSPEEQQQAKLQAIAQLKSELGLDKLELMVSEIRQGGKVQPLQQGQSGWRDFAKEILAVISEGMKQMGGQGGDGGLSQMLMMDALEWNRMSKAILMRAVAKGLGQTLPEHRVVR